MGEFVCVCKTDMIVYICVERRRGIKMRERGEVDNKEHVVTAYVALQLPPSQKLYTLVHTHTYIYIHTQHTHTHIYINIHTSTCPLQPLRRRYRM